MKTIINKIFGDRKPVVHTGKTADQIWLLKWKKSDAKAAGNITKRPKTISDNKF